MFLNLWSIMISWPFQFAIFAMPGKDPQSFYFCTGKFPMKFFSKKLKPNWANNLLALSSLALHLGIGIRTWAFKYQARRADEIAMGLSAADHRNKTISNQTLVGLTTNVVLVVMMHLTGIIPIYVNTLEPTYVDRYPHYILAFIQNILIYPLFFLVLGISYCIRNKDLRLFIQRNCGNVLRVLKPPQMIELANQ